MQAWSPHPPAKMTQGNPQSQDFCGHTSNLKPAEKSPQQRASAKRERYEKQQHMAAPVIWHLDELEVCKHQQRKNNPSIDYHTRLVTWPSQVLNALRKLASVELSGMVPAVRACPCQETIHKAHPSMHLWANHLDEVDHGVELVKVANVLPHSHNVDPTPRVGWTKLFRPWKRDCNLARWVDWKWFFFTHQHKPTCISIMNHCSCIQAPDLFRCIGVQQTYGIRESYHLSKINMIIILSHMSHITYHISPYCHHSSYHEVRVISVTSHHANRIDPLFKHTSSDKWSK